MRRAFHLRAGQRVMVESIDAWLSDHDFDVAGCTDALDACAHLLRNLDQPAQLVFIGADWFCADDYALFNYVREAWPRAGIVAYGQTLEPPPFAAPDLCVYCASRSALRTLLDKTPAGLMKHLRQLAPAHGERIAQPSVSLSNAQLGAPPVSAAPPAPAATSGEANLRSPGGLLTPEELAALLSEE